ncbi:hypothetical protein [Deinococcus sedimenti]|uniref:Uncharacterized protein n=1 Tax=Deinococcus sedimenti TaxID=1867090 RepID=A0ABQ2S752_9DEIO|nr:hypothetical protein [Deinococcus sedimenti]GGS01813.1 hypothetical protein GCM10008960_30580 [Deinococcus sedimenti]
MDDLTRRLTRAARDLRLDGQVPSDADPDALATLARVVLEELIARGVLPDPQPQVGCWSTPRSGLH